jgi:hypothetical protein
MAGDASPYATLGLEPGADWKAIEKAITSSLNAITQTVRAEMRRVLPRSPGPIAS